MHNLSNQNTQEFRPLADRMRPGTFKDFFGQEEVAEFIARYITEGKIPSLLFWGPPGTGKTTLANIIAEKSNCYFLPMSAVTAKIADVKIKINEAAERLREKGEKTIIFIDEIHRFNKLQQDIFLPHVEKGIISLIGATTENPSFEVNSALLSRCKVLVLKRLTEENIISIIKNVLKDSEKGLGELNLEFSEDAFFYLASYADGDARRALNLLEETANILAKSNDKKTITAKALSYISKKSSLLYDKDGEEHYNLISALHKCMRDSDADAALYWFGRMIVGGEDPLFIARRLIRFASEDIGAADPQALVVAVAAKDAFHFIGIPEGELALAQAVVYLAKAPKDNDLYIAYGKVKEDIEQFGSLPVPMNLRNAPTKLMQDLGYGKDYKYAHNFPDAIVEQDHFPKEIGNRKYLK
ncbi:MAG: replication-associated recombination protein A [bacterium]